MANFGLSKPWIAELDTKTKQYKNAFKCGELVNTSVNPQYNTAALYGDNRKTEEIRLLKSADVTLGVTRLPLQAVKVMFGHRVDGDGTEVSNAADKNKYVGYAFITREMVESVEQYRACLLLKVMFNEGQEDYETQGENVTFKTPIISGGALTIDNGDWRIKSPYFDTEDEADSWIKKQLGVKEEVTEPPTEDNSGSTENEQGETTEESEEDDTY